MVNNIDYFNVSDFNKASLEIKKQASKKFKQFNHSYGTNSFFSMFSIKEIIRKHHVLNRWLTLTANIENLKDGGARVKSDDKIFNDDVNNQIVKRFIDKAFPDYHELTCKYIVAGYVLETGWEKEIVNYLKNDNVRKMSDELIFILFSTKMPVNDFLELSELPKSYLAKLLPMKEME